MGRSLVKRSRTERVCVYVCVCVCVCVCGVIACDQVKQKPSAPAVSG